MARVSIRVTVNASETWSSFTVNYCISIESMQQRGKKKTREPIVVWHISCNESNKRRTKWVTEKLRTRSNLRLGMCIWNVPSPNNTCGNLTWIPRLIWRTDMTKSPKAGQGRLLFGLYLDFGSALHFSANLPHSCNDIQSSYGELNRVVDLSSRRLNSEQNSWHDVLASKTKNCMRQAAASSHSTSLKVKFPLPSEVS